MSRNLDNYVTVDKRIAAFYVKYPEGSLQSELLFPDENTVRCKAYAYRTPDDPRPGIGHAEEKRDAGPVNRTSAVENSETSAWGRALAALGLEVTKGVASREEVEIARRKEAAQKNTTEPGSGPQNVPERYAEFLRLAIRERNPKELQDDAEWQAVLAAATSKERNAQLVKSLEAALRDNGGDPELVKVRWQKARRP